MINAAAAGMLTGLALIVAIGAQNAFVLRQGILRSHVGPVVAICAISDAVLIMAGVAGIGTVIDRAGWLLDVVLWLGVAFLVGYGILALRRAAISAGGLEATQAVTGTLAAAVTTALALTWLNPHVYLDTVLMLGSLAATHGGDRWWFGTGALLGSLVWFVTLGYGAKRLQPLFRSPVTWRVLDGFIGVMMLGLALMLVFKG